MSNKMSILTIFTLEISNESKGSKMLALVSVFDVESDFGTHKNPLSKCCRMWQCWLIFSVPDAANRKIYILPENFLKLMVATLLSQSAS